MSADASPRLDISAQWGRLNETIVSLIDDIPDGKLGWSPQPDLWNFRGIILHTIVTRDNWLSRCVGDGEQTPNVLEIAQTKDGMRGELRRSWERVRRFLSDPETLDAKHRWDDESRDFEQNGHWIAFHLLEHDIHHRSDIFHYLALLGIEHPDVGTP